MAPLGQIDLSYAAPRAGSVVTASSKPAPVPPNYQWSFYPNPEFEEILGQTNIPFPKLTSADLEKVSKRLTKLGYADAAAATCTLDGVAYSELRCAAPLPSYLRRCRSWATWRPTATPS